MSFKKILGTAAAGMLLGMPATSQQLSLSLESVDGQALLAGAALRLKATLPSRSESGLAPELPAIYIDSYQGNAKSLSDAACAARVQGYERSLGFNAPTLDLLAYQLVTLSAEGTLIVLDPRGGFGSSRLLDRLELGSQPGPLLHDGERRHLWVSLPERPALTLIDTADWKVLKEFPLAAPAVALGQGPEGRWALIADSVAGTSELLLFAATGAAPDQPQSRFALPPGKDPQVLWADDSLFAIANSRLYRHQPSGWQDLDRPASGFAYSPAAAALVLLTPVGGLELLEPSGAPRAELPPAREGDRELTLSPDGRWAMVWSKDAPDLRVADLARQTWQGELHIASPAEIAFSERFFYVRSATQAEVLVTPLASLASPGLVAGKLVAGGTRPHPLPRHASMATFPGADTLFWASAADRQIYAYHEGMNAASGSLAHPGANPVDLWISGPLLREVAPGAFAAKVVLPRPGRYLVAALARQPYAVACRLVDIAGAPGESLPQEARLENFELPSEWPARSRFQLRFEVRWPDGELPEEVPVLVMSPAGTWQNRFAAKHRQGATFEAELEVPAAGPHFVLVRWPLSDGRELVRRLGIEILPATGSRGGAK